MKQKALPDTKSSTDLLVAPASASTWVVAFSRHLIPGACFKTRRAALGYAALLASASGLGRSHVRVLGDA